MKERKNERKEKGRTNERTRERKEERVRGFLQKLVQLKSNREIPRGESVQKAVG